MGACHHCTVIPRRQSDLGVAPSTCALVMLCGQKSLLQVRVGTWYSGAKTGAGEEAGVPGFSVPASSPPASWKNTRAISSQRRWGGAGCAAGLTAKLAEQRAGAGTLGRASPPRLVRIPRRPDLLTFSALLPQRRLQGPSVCCHEILQNPIPIMPLL